VCAGSEHLAEFLVQQTALQKLLLREVAVVVFVHLVEDGLCSLLGRVRRSRRRVGAQHVVDGLHYLGHLLDVDDAVAVHVVHAERPLELLFGRPCRRDVYGEQELLKVDVSVLVHVEGPEDVVTEFLGVAAREEHLVHVDEFVGGEAAVRTVLPEAPVPLLDHGLVVSRVGL